MTLTLYWTGRQLALQAYWWAKAVGHGTIVNYGRSFRVRETPAEIDALYDADLEKGED